MRGVSVRAVPAIAGVALDTTPERRLRASGADPPDRLGPGAATARAGAHPPGGRAPAAGPGTLRIVNIDWSSWWSNALNLTLPDIGPSHRALWIALAVLVAVLTLPTPRRWGRTLVTIVHEAGHAAAGVLVGRRFQGFVVEKNLAGHAVTAGRERGPGRAFTTWAGYPTPAVLGALVALAALGGWSGAVLILAVVALLVLLVMSRSVRTALLVAFVIVLTLALWWWGDAIGGVPLRAGIVAGTGMALLVGAWDSLRDVAASRDGAQDHRTLASLTGAPAGVWLATWFLVDALATAAVARSVWEGLT